METYEFSKLRRLLALVSNYAAGINHEGRLMVGTECMFEKPPLHTSQIRFMMEDTMRFLVDKSLQAYVTYITAACSQKLQVKSTNHIEVLPSSENKTPINLRRAPLLFLELQIAKEGTHFVYRYSNSNVDEIYSHSNVIQTCGSASVSAVSDSPQSFWITCQCT